MAKAKTRSRSQEPPPLELGDHGVRWARDGSTLRIWRGPNLRALILPVGVFAIIVFIAVQSLRDGAWWTGGSMAFASLFAGVFVWIRLTHRAEITVGPDRISWLQHRPRPFEGHWSRDQVDGIRINVHAKSRWLEPRQAHVDLRVDGDWKMFLFSGRLRRAERFAEDLALTIGLVPDRVEDGR